MILGHRFGPMRSETPSLLLGANNAVARPHNQFYRLFGKAVLFSRAAFWLLARSCEAGCGPLGRSGGALKQHPLADVRATQNGQHRSHTTRTSHGPIGGHTT